MAKFQVILERIDTTIKQAEVAVEAANAEEARQQITSDLEVDPGAYDDDLEPVEDCVGEITIKEVESQDERITQFPRAVAGRAY